MKEKISRWLHEKAMEACKIYCDSEELISWEDLPKEYKDRYMELAQEIHDICHQPSDACKEGGAR